MSTPPGMIFVPPAFHLTPAQHICFHVSFSWKPSVSSHFPPSPHELNGGGREGKKGGTELSTHNHFLRVNIQISTVAHKALHDLDSYPSLTFLSTVQPRFILWPPCCYIHSPLCLRVFPVAVPSSWKTLPADVSICLSSSPPLKM